ncbi:hypothetical protein BRC81_17225 [Halobacteriales archaeon QS_1_68_20]|nr:MAG: hypothetical protein BRC81_17225 [Halobacteriales archaeon QS_1_68_20]
MDARTRTSLLWGLVGAMTFLVLVQGYELLRSVPVGFATKLAVAAIVGVVAAGLTYAAEGWLRERLRGADRDERV